MNTSKLVESHLAEASTPLYIVYDSNDKPLGKFTDSNKAKRYADKQETSTGYIHRVKSYEVNDEGTKMLLSKVWEQGDRGWNMYPAKDYVSDNVWQDIPKIASM